MKRIFWLSLATLVIMLLFSRCSHPTNNQDPPAGADLTITSPTNESWVEGTVTIEVSPGGIAPTLVEFYVDGKVVGTKESWPWQVTWDTRNLPPNSHHTLRARAYSASHSYKTSSEVVVRIK